MNKDAVLASAIGFSVGLIITGIVLIGPYIVKSFPRLSLPKSASSGVPTPTQSAIQGATQAKELTIESPQADAIVDKTSLLVSGLTMPNSLTIVSTSLEDAVVQVKEDGAYAGTIKIQEGANDIYVTSYFNGKSETKHIRVYYTTESL